MVQRREIAFTGARPRSHLFAVAAVVALSMLLHVGAAVAQLQPAAAPPQVAPQAQPAPEAQPAPPPKKEGFFDALGKWWDQSAADFDASLKKMKSDIDSVNERNAKAVREAAQGAATATKEATDALSKLPATRIVEGRERCALAPNGSPDCGPAAETICKAKGFKSGASANIESARKCSARALLSRSEEDCVNETIVTRAACQ